MPDPGLLLVAPALAIVVAFFIVPLGISFALAFRLLAEGLGPLHDTGWGGMITIVAVLSLGMVCFALFVIAGVTYGLYLRLIVNPERYAGSHRGKGVMVLSFILTIMLSLLVMNGLRINLNEDLLGRYKPVSTLIGGLFAGLSEFRDPGSGISGCFKRCISAASAASAAPREHMSPP